MQGGQAFQTSEERRTGGFHADVARLCEVSAPGGDACSESERADQPTRPYEATSDTPPPASFSTGSPEWCVDAGRALWTMSTFGLWEALERGRVTASMRVWREGMECWTPVGDLAEFTWALAVTPEPSGEPAFAPKALAPAPAANDARSEIAREDPTADADTLRPPASTLHPVRARRSLGRWIAAGSLVGAAAVVAAILVRTQAPPAPPELATRGMAMGGSSDALTLATPRPARPARDTAARHDERGQHRLPRSGHADDRDPAR
jgi:hypothetical protein